MPAMPAMLGFSMNDGRAPETELAALTDADGDKEEEDETAMDAVVTSELEDEEVGTVLPPPKPNRSGYM